MKKVLLYIPMVLAGLAASAQTYYQEDFTAGIPSGWAQTTLATDGGWLAETATAGSSTSFAIPAATGNILATNDDQCNCDKSNDFVHTQAISLVGAVNPYFTVDMFYFAGTYQGTTESMTFELSTDNGTTWTVVETVSGNTANAWQPRAYPLSAYNGQSVMLGFRYNDNAGWMFGCGLDNFKVFEPDLSVIDANIGASSIALNVPAVPGLMGGFTRALVGEAMVPVVTINNNAFAAITSFDISYSDGTNTVTESVTGQNIGFGGSYDHSFATPYAVASGANALSFTISNVNGGTETVTDNNTASASITGVTATPGRLVIAEEGTGTWCGWCVRGHVFMDYLVEKYPSNFFGIAVHNGDPMVVDAYDTAIGGVISGYPSGLVDRKTFNGSAEVDPSDFENAMLARIDQAVNVTVNTNIVNYDNGNYGIVSNLNFAAATNGGYRIAQVLVEDGVHGTGSTWNQTNYYSGGGNGPMGGYEDLGASVAASTMTYNHVARALVGPYTGVVGSVPTSNAAGSTLNFEQAVTVDPTWNLDNVRAVTLFIKSSTGEIINAGVSNYLALAVNETEKPAFGLNLFPNPAGEQANIRVAIDGMSDVVVKVIDGAGRIVAQHTYNNMTGEQIIPMNTANFSAGFYTLSVLANNSVINKTFIVQH
jgi:Outer membrane protein Omp28/Secretion system C-terminal sorting domain